MSTSENNNLPEEMNNEQKNETPKNEISKKIQYIVGAAFGILTSLAIYISGNYESMKFYETLVERIKDTRNFKPIDFIFNYLFLIVFVIFMFGIRRIETRREISLRPARTAYLIAMIPGLLFFIYLAITTC